MAFIQREHHVNHRNVPNASDPDGSHRRKEIQFQGIDALYMPARRLNSCNNRSGQFQGKLGRHLFN
ncbi:hypothetical protein PsorP6_006424 [Peronosclerospora sorghi]|uniref:Uncharacterized protein n=1 Tax=Peronosclerospora sorghi TaxID=230839 RepID=A0ACC0W5B4_9STRA|nr:hypothetical protein PsorP6_006424 [Peronosclerospora sorghi]